MAIEIASKCFRYLKVAGENTSMCQVLSFRKSESFLANRDVQKEIEFPYEKAKKAIVPPKIRCLPVQWQRGELTLVKRELWNQAFCLLLALPCTSAIKSFLVTKAQSPVL